MGHDEVGVHTWTWGLWQPQPRQINEGRKDVPAPRDAGRPNSLGPPPFPCKLVRITHTSFPFIKFKNYPCPRGSHLSHNNRRSNLFLNDLYFLV